MGWDFYCDPSNGKAKVLEDLRSVGNESWELLGMAVVGSHVWRALKNVDGRKIIALDWIKGGGRNSGWGVKDLPYHEHLDCPQKIIDLVPEHQVNDPERYAKWKIMVAEERVGKNAKAKAAANLVPGMAVTIHGKPYVLVRKRDPGKPGWIVRDPRGNIYRASRNIEAAA